MRVRAALQYGCRVLEEAGIAAPRLTAEVLLAHALGRDRAWLYGHPEEEVDCAAFERALAQRALGRPTQYITGRQEFYGAEFLLNPQVFIPRPETEHVVETALRLAGPGAPRIVDVGCGSGAIAVSLSRLLRRAVYATDVSTPALEVARENARRLGGCVYFAACDLLGAFAGGSFDLVVSNPPYIPTADEPGLQREVRDYEPRIALYAGVEGLDAYRRLVVEAARVLRPGGHLVMELGFRQAEAVRGMLESGWRHIEIVSDLAGLPRVIAAEIP